MSLFRQPRTVFRSIEADEIAEACRNYWMLQKLSWACLLFCSSLDARWARCSCFLLFRSPDAFLVVPFPSRRQRSTLGKLCGAPPSARQPSQGCSKVRRAGNLLLNHQKPLTCRLYFFLFSSTSPAPTNICSCCPRSSRRLCIWTHPLRCVPPEAVALGDRATVDVRPSTAKNS